MGSLVRDGDGVGGWLVLLWILGRHFHLLPMIEGAQVVWGGLMGPPVVPECGYGVPVEGWGWVWLLPTIERA